MTKKTLGGDRLGAGKKMQVELHGYERSTHDLSYLWRSTTSAGTLVPFMKQICLPGDTWDIDLQCEVLTHPTIGPLFGSFKVQLDIFEAPFRLYNSWLHNNKLNVGRDMSQVKLPQLTMTATYVDDAIDPDNSQINPSSILSYLGIRGVGGAPSTGGPYTRTFNAIPLLAYWEIFKNYYANKQEETAYVIHTPQPSINETVDTIEIGGTTLAQAPAETFIGMGVNTQIEITYTSGDPTPQPEMIMINTAYNGRRSLADLGTMIDTTIAGKVTVQYNYARYGADVWKSWDYIEATEIFNTEPQLQGFNLTDIDDMREQILANPGNIPFYIDGGSTSPYNYVLAQTLGKNNALGTQEGLAVKTYQSDLFNNWINTDWIDGPGGINEITKVSTAGDAFTIDALQLARKVYDMLNRVAVSGGSYNDWVEVMYDHRPFVIAESPMYHGGLSKELIFQEVVSNSAAGSGDDSASQPLGTLAGKGRLSGKHKGGKVVIKPGEIGVLMGIFSLTPRIDYSQGNDWDTHLQTMDDLHKPGLDQIGFQELIREQKAWWDTNWAGGDWVTQSSGKQPAWVNYMTNVNKTYGNFAIQDNEMFMTLNRRYEGSTNTGGITDDTTYIDPTKFNFIFAETALDAQNFWVQIGVNIECRRKMSAKLMPNL